MNTIIRVKNTKFRDALMNHQDGETVYCEEEQKAYVWNNKKWNEINLQTDSTGEIKVNYRDLVISAITNFSPIDKEGFKNYQVLINKWDEYRQCRFYMLYGREIDYFTIFERTNDSANRCLGKEIFNCLNNVGSILYVEEFDDDTNAIIFWIKTTDNRITEIYLFDYTEGVVPFI